MMRRAWICFALTIALLNGQAGHALQLRLKSDPTTLDWTQSTSNSDTYTLMNVMRGLVRLDHNLQTIPELAKSWTVSPDGKTITFTLKEGIVWSDGVALTSEHFLNAWKRMLDPKTDNEYSNFLFDILGAEAFHRGQIKDFSKIGIKAPSSQTIVIQLRRIVPYFVSLFSFWSTFPIREDLMKKFKAQWSKPENLVTLGPYKIKRWEVGKSIEFTKNPLFHEWKNNASSTPPDFIEGVIVTQDSEARTSFINQKIDALFGITTADLTTILTQTRRKWQVRHFDYLATAFLGFNCKAKPLDSPLVRKAIAQAIERKKFSSILGGGQVEAHSFIPRGLLGFDPKAALPYSIPGAKQLLNQSSLQGPSRIPPLELIAIKGDHEKAAFYLKKILHDSLGLEIRVTALEPGAFFKQRKLGQFHLYVGQWGADYPDAASFMEILLSQSSNNHMRWKNLEYDNLIEKAGSTLNVLERQQYYTLAQNLALQKEAVLVPLFFPKITVLLQPHIAQFDVTPLNYLFFERIKKLKQDH